MFNDRLRLIAPQRDEEENIMVTDYITEYVEDISDVDSTPRIHLADTGLTAPAVQTRTAAAQPTRAKSFDAREKMQLTLSAKNLSFSVKTKEGRKQIVNDVSFDVKSGEVLVMMGPSGAGKTSVLNMLTSRAQTNPAGTTGTVTLNGVPLPTIMTTHCAYVEQFSDTWAFLTPRELIRSASRFYCRSPDQASDHEESVIQLMGMNQCADVKCGNEFFAGLSGGQKRRLATALALVKFPLIVFMDEPLSGLDSAAADSIMDLIKLTAKEIQTIFVVTMHQPSTAMFLGFEHVMMLTKGEIAYYGAGRDLAGYCETSIMSQVPYGVNPCDHFLRHINPDFVGEKQAVESIDIWKKYAKTSASGISHDACGFAKNGNTGFPHTGPTASMYVVPVGGIPAPLLSATVTQKILLLLRRQAVLILRDPTLYTGRMIFYLFSNLFFTLVYIGVRDLKQEQIFPRLLLVLWFVAVPCNLAIVTVHSQSMELQLVLKEVRNGMYSPGMYMLVTSLLQIPMIALLVLFAIVIPGYAVAKFHLGNAHEFLSVVFFIFYSFEASAQFFAVAFRNPLIGMMCFINWWFASFLFCGFLVDPEEVIWPLKIFYYIVPFNWGIRGMAHAEFRNAEFSGAEIVDTSISPRGFICPDVPQMQCYGKYGEQALTSLGANIKIIDPNTNLLHCCGFLFAGVLVFKFAFFTITWERCG